MEIFDILLIQGVKLVKEIDKGFASTGVWPMECGGGDEGVILFDVFFLILSDTYESNVWLCIKWGGNQRFYNTYQVYQVSYS